MPETNFNWMGFIINVSLSEDFCVIRLSRPFGRNCRGTEEERLSWQSAEQTGSAKSIV